MITGGSVGIVTGSLLASFISVLNFIPSFLHFFLAICFHASLILFSSSQSQASFIDFFYSPELIELFLIVIVVIFLCYYDDNLINEIAFSLNSSSFQLTIFTFIQLNFFNHYWCLYFIISKVYYIRLKQCDFDLSKNLSFWWIYRNFVRILPWNP